MKINGKSNSIAGIFVGIIFLIGGLILLWWNEGRTVKAEKAIKEAEGTYIDVSSDKVDASNNGKLIATYGSIKTDKDLEDDVFGIILNTTKMKRQVEVYQWSENCSEDDNGKETCDYTKKWDEELIDSSKFKESVDHSNPKTKQYDSKTFVATATKIGEYVVPNSLVSKLSTKEYVKIDSSNDDMRYAATQLKLNIDADGKYFTNYDGTTPEVGDIRISFVYNDAKELSMMGVQNGNTINEFKAKSGNKIYELYEGSHNGADMIQFLRNENNTLKVILRVVGILAVVIGLLAIISPIQKLASYIPIIGAIFNGATTLIAILFGLALSLIDIAIAWIAYRPVLGISLLVVAVGLIVTGTVLKKKKSTPVQQNVNQQPVAQPVQEVQQPVEQNTTDDNQMQ